MEKPRISLIAAVARNGVIGKDNALPWRLPEDLRHFKAVTLGHPIVMGRKTWESLGRPLPGRHNIVVTRRTDYGLPGECTAVNSLAEAIAAADDCGELFVIGGADLYTQALPLADRLYLTEIDAEFAGDAWFPDFDRSAWREASRQAGTSEAGLRYAFVTYER